MPRLSGYELPNSAPAPPVNSSGECEIFQYDGVIAKIVSRAIYESRHQTLDNAGIEPDSAEGQSRMHRRASAEELIGVVGKRILTAEL